MDPPRAMLTQSKPWNRSNARRHHRSAAAYWSTPLQLPSFQKNTWVRAKICPSWSRARWSRTVEMRAYSRGVRHTIAYAREGTCDDHLRCPTRMDAPETYRAAFDRRANHRRRRCHRLRRAHRLRPSGVAHGPRPGHREGERPSAAESSRRPASRRNPQPPKVLTHRTAAEPRARCRVRSAPGPAAGAHPPQVEDRAPRTARARRAHLGGDHSRRGRGTAASPLPGARHTYQPPPLAERQGARRRRQVVRRRPAGRDEAAHADQRRK